MPGIQGRARHTLLATFTLVALASCTVKSEGQNFVPGATGAGGTGFMGFPFVFDGGAGTGGNADTGGPVGGAGGGLTFPVDASADLGRDAATADASSPTDVPRDSGGGQPDLPGVAGAIGDKCVASITCGPGSVCAADVAGGGYCTADCTATGSCPAGSTCIGDASRICVKTCATPTACRAEHTCLQGFCLPKCTQDSDCDSSSCDRTTGLCGPSRVGNACTLDADCGAYPAFCDRTDPTGYCSVPCGGPMNLACPDNANCISAGSAGACLKACTGPADCRVGFLCATGTGGVSACIPRCVRNEDCAPGLRCDANSGACVEATAARGTLGGSCATAADCTAVGAGAFCVADATFPGGYCSLPCENSPCPASGLCVPFTPPEANCLSKCNVPSDCRDGYTCFSVQSGGGVCFPKCTMDAECSDPGLVCDKNSGHCVTKPVGPPVTMNGVTNLTPNGPVQLNAGFQSERFVITVPADAVSINFFGQAVSDPTADIFVSRLEQSTDDFVTATRLYDATSLSNPVSFPPALVPGSFSILHPNTPSAPFTTSTAATTVKLAIRVVVSQPTTVSISAIVKRAPSQALTQGQLDLNLFFVGLPQLDATSAKTDLRFKQMFDTARGIWAMAGITVGTVNYIDITGADAARFSDLDADTDMGALMTRSNNPAAKEGALNIFFVHTISGGSLAGYVILGQSAGIPGVPVRGTTGSGMAVTTADFPQGLAEMADTWAHEGGHWLGLFHTTESSGTAFDPLPDTPQCPRSPYDINNDRIMAPGECKTRGAENVMFWTSTPTIPNGSMSANQSFVVLRNPTVR